LEIFFGESVQSYSSKTVQFSLALTGADERNKIDCYNKVFEAFLKNYELFR